MVASVDLPRSSQLRQESGERKAHARGKLEVSIKINHQGEVNRARCMPQNPFVIATKSPSCDVFVFDVSKHPSSPKDDGFRPEHKCLGHSKEGYGLSWNPHVPAKLLSGSDDCRICVWDLNQGGEHVSAVNTWVGHSDVVEDVAWHNSSPHVFGSVGDDKKMLMWDTRVASSTGPFIRVPSAHDADINSLAFNQHHEFLLATGSADRVVKIWDMRNTTEAVHKLHGHGQEVFQVQWAPFDGSLLASCGADRRTRIWDLTKIEEYVSEEAKLELLFVHGGHNDKVSDVSWNSRYLWLIASVSDDNVLQIWQRATRPI
jgi:histone-binding protein RBBP4